MNEPSPTLAYYDRSTGLIVFGILTIGLGCLAALLVVFMIFAVVLQSATTHVPAGNLIPGMLMYVALAVILVWLGIGSIFAKRWARNLLLIFSWSWLVMGCLIEATAAIVLPMVLTQIPGQEGRPAPPAYVMWIMIACLLLFYGVIFVVLPAIWTYFYNSRHVKGTCEWRDPNPGWTDACPLPVLAASLWAVLSGLTIASMVLIPHCIVPFFGVLLTGLSARTLCAGLAAIWFVCAGLLYRLDVRGWWVNLITVVIVVVSSTVTYSLHDMIDVYKLMDYPQDQIDQLQKISLFKGHMMAWMTVPFVLPVVGYLIFIKRYFQR